VALDARPGFRGVGRKDPAHNWREVSEPEK
jgi:hypothetical protein